MIENDRKVYEKMIGIWSITRIPQLEMTPPHGEVLFRWSMGEIVSMPFKLFDELVPLEIVSLVEQQIEQRYNVNPQKFRVDLSGYRKNPFSSQK